jgi:hypothetical protein
LPSLNEEIKEDEELKEEDSEVEDDKLVLPPI